MSIYTAVLEHLQNKRYWFQETGIFNSLLFSESVWALFFHTLYPFFQPSSKKAKKLLDCSHTRLKQSFWDRVAASCLLKVGKKTNNQGQNFSVCSGPTSCLLVQLPALFISCSSPRLISECSRLVQGFTGPEIMISF